MFLLGLRDVFILPRFLPLFVLYSNTRIKVNGISKLLCTNRVLEYVSWLLQPNHESTLLQICRNIISDFLFSSVSAKWSGTWESARECGFKYVESGLKCWMSECGWVVHCWMQIRPHLKCSHFSFQSRDTWQENSILISLSFLYIVK